MNQASLEQIIKQAIKSNVLSFDIDNGITGEKGLAALIYDELEPLLSTKEEVDHASKEIEGLIIIGNLNIVPSSKNNESAFKGDLKLNYE